MNILVAEDDQNDFDLLELAFQRNAIPVSLKRVRDGQEAIDYLTALDADEDGTSDFVPTLLLTDLDMPRADGFEVIRWVRHNPKLKRMVVVVLSSSTKPRDLDLAYEMGANSYLTKPLRFEEWTARLKLLSRYWAPCSEKPRGQGPVNCTGL